MSYSTKRLPCQCLEHWSLMFTLPGFTGLLCCSSPTPYERFICSLGYLKWWLIKLKNPKKQLLCRAKHLARGRMHTNSSLVTVSNGIPSILMFGIADSLKCIFRERERERWRDGGGSDCGPAETLTWINQGNINTVSGMKWWEGALLPQIFRPRDPSERQGTPLSCLPITACSNYLFS